MIYFPLGNLDISTTSFFPAKPLGCYGDGGAVFEKVVLGESSIPNGFDNLLVDVAALFRDYPADQVFADVKLWHSAKRLYANGLVPQRVRELLWHGLRRTRLEQEYYTRFRAYWSRVLGGRPLWGVEDFHFLRGVYRMRFQRMAATPASAGHLGAWQDSAVLHHLLHSVYKESQQNALEASIKSVNYSLYGKNG